MTISQEIVREALLAYRDRWTSWLNLWHTTEAERELAKVKIALIDQELEKPNPALTTGICHWCGKEIYKNSLSGCWEHYFNHKTVCDSSGHSADPKTTVEDG